MATNNAVNGQFSGAGNRMPSSFVQAGNPNTVVSGSSLAGAQGDIYFDTTGLVGYTCTTGGASGTAVWSAESASSSAFGWLNTTTTTQAMAVNNGYISNNAALSTFTLPAVATVGQRVAIQGSGAGGWLLAQNTGQSIKFGVVTTTAGATGSLASTNANDHIEVMCTVANTTWEAFNAQGNITYV